MSHLCPIYYLCGRKTNTHMAKVVIKLDKRKSNAQGASPVKLYVYHERQMYFSTGLTATPQEWDARASQFLAKDPAARSKNAKLRDMFNRCDMLLLQLSVDGELPRLTAKALRARIEQELGVRRATSALLIDYLAKAKTGKAERTQRLFEWTRQRVADYDGDIRVADITEEWVANFRDKLLGSYAPNTVQQALAHVSRAISIAITDGLLQRNPCSGVRKPRAETRKKALSLEQLRQLRDMTFEGCYAKTMEYARDMFMLQFYLLGINVVDLYDLREVVNGRVEYKRHKTRTLYSVKVEPEAMEIIERWRGEKTLVTHCASTAAYMCTMLTRWLGKMLPKLSTNYARHTWATLAAELELPIETVSHALGHKIGSPITAIYVAFNQRKVDEANRRIIDYINADLLEKGKKKAKKAKGKK